MASGSPNTQTMHLPFDGGIDQRQHPRQTGNPSVNGATNVRFPRLGAVDKRYGNTPVATGFLGGYTMVAGQGRVFAFRDELLVTDGFRIGSLSRSTANVNRFIDKGKVPEATSTARAIDTTQYFVSQPDIAYSSDGLIFHVWAANDRSTTSLPKFDIFWTVANAETGAEVASSKAYSVGGFDFWGPRVVTAGANAMMFAFNGTNIVAQVWDPATYTWTNLGTILAATTGTGLGVCSDGTAIFLVYGRTTNIITVKKYNAATGALIASVDCSENVLPTTANSFSVMAPVGEQVWIAYTRLTNPLGAITVRCATFAHDLSSQLVAPFTVHSDGAATFSTTGLARVSATSALVLCGVAAQVGSNDASASYIAAPVVSSATSAVVGNASATNRKTFWAIAGSSPFVASTAPLRIYAWVYTGGTYLGQNPPQSPDQALQFTFMLVDLMADDTATVRYVARPITWQNPRFARTDSTARQPGTQNGVTLFQPPSVASMPNGVWTTDCIVRRNAATRIGLNEVRATFAGPTRFVASELGRTMIMAPGFFWDRAKMAEISFAYWPQRIDIAAPNGGHATGGFMSNGEQYAYKILYEYVDGTGAVHRSEPSEQVIVTVPGAIGGFVGSVSFKVPCLCVTARQGAELADEPNGVRIVVYRAGPMSFDPNTFYRVFEDASTPQNKPLQATFVITDVAADITRNTSDPKVQLDTLYTMGGVLPNVMPAGFTSVCTYLNRVWIAYGNTVTYSKSFVTGEAVSFTDAFELPLEESGDITAMWVMDDTLYISTANRIYYLQAYGPNDTGGGNDVNIPNRVATDLGVIDQRSIVVTPLGTLYQSATGIQLMSRARAVDPEPVGARIRDDLLAYPEITSAILHPSGRYVSFCARAPGALGDTLYRGVRLIFDYATNRWSRDTMNSDNDVFGQGMLGEAVSRGQVYSLFAALTNNKVQVEDPTTYLDGGGWVTMSIDMAEIHPSGLQGWLGFEKWTLNHERFSDHDITMSWFRDYSTVAFETKIWTSDKLPADDNQQFSHNTSIHRCMSMRMKISDGNPTGPGAVFGTGQGAAFVGLAVEVDPLDNKTFRLAAARKG